MMQFRAQKQIQCKYSHLWIMFRANLSYHLRFFVNWCASGIDLMHHCRHVFFLQKTEILADIFDPSVVMSDSLSFHRHIQSPVTHICPSLCVPFFLSVIGSNMNTALHPSVTDFSGGTLSSPHDSISLRLSVAFAGHTGKNTADCFFF